MFQVAGGLVVGIGAAWLAGTFLLSAGAGFNSLGNPVVLAGTAVILPGFVLLAWPVVSRRLNRRLAPAPSRQRAPSRICGGAA
jgi:hypothetical protein